jgi:ATP-dependent DNA ligase
MRIRVIPQIASCPIRVSNACGIVRRATLWLMREAVAQIAFLEWTGADHLRHAKFVGFAMTKILTGSQGDLGSGVVRADSRRN